MRMLRSLPPLEVVNEDGGTAVPSFSVIRKVTVGFCPGREFVTETISLCSPFSCFDSDGITCAPRIEASQSRSPTGRWQLAHCESSGCGPAGWFAPVTKSTSSWQDPHAVRDGNMK